MRWIAALVIHEVVSVDVAGLHAVQYEVKMALEKGVPYVVVEMDSQVVFSAMRRPKEDIF